MTVTALLVLRELWKCNLGKLPLTQVRADSLSAVKNRQQNYFDDRENLVAN
jgi:hypothetical protein